MGTEREALVGARLSATILKPSDGRAVIAAVAVVALAHTVVAKTVVAAVIQLGACFQTAVMTTPARFALAFLWVLVTLSVSRAHVWTIFLFTLLATIVGSTEARSVVTLTVGLVASLRAGSGAAVGPAESIIAVTNASEIVADTIAAAVVQATTRLGLALKSHKTGRAQTVSVVTLATVVSTVSVAGFLTTRSTLPANLTEACRFVTTVTILAVWADRFGTISTTIADLTLTLSGDAIACPMSRASIGAHSLLATLAHVTRTTVTSTIHASTVRRAVAWATLQRAIITSPSNLAHTMGSDAVTMARAFVRTWSSRAIGPSETSEAEALALVTDAVFGAVV